MQSLAQGLRFAKAVTRHREPLAMDSELQQEPFAMDSYSTWTGTHYTGRSEWTPTRHG